MATVIEEFVAKIGWKIDGKPVKEASKDMEGLWKNAMLVLKAVMAFKGLKMFADMSAETIKAADAIDKMSRRIGVARGELQKWDFVAGMAGTSIKEMEVSVRKMQQTIYDAGSGSQMALDVFKNLGIDIKSSAGGFKSATEILPEIADAMAGITDSTMKTALAQKLLGEAGVSLIPVLEQGSSAIREQMKELEELGAVMDEDFITQATKVTDNALRIKKSFLGMKIAITRELAPAIIRAQEKFIKWWKVNKDWIKSKIFKKVKDLADFFENLGEEIGAAYTGFKKWYDSLGPTEKKILNVAAAMGVLSLALKMGPIGKLILLGTLIMLAIEDWHVFKEGGRSAISEINKALWELTGFSLEIWVEELGKSIQKFASTVDYWMMRSELSLARAETAFWKFHDDFNKMFNEWWNDAFLSIGNFFSNSVEAGRQWVNDMIALVAEPIQKMFNKVGSMASGVLGFFGFDTSGFDNVTLNPSAGAVQSTISNSSSRSTSNSNTSNNNVVNIYAAPGQSEKSIGREAAKAIRQNSTGVAI